MRRADFRSIDQFHLLIAQIDEREPPYNTKLSGLISICSQTRIFFARKWKIQRVWNYTFSKIYKLQVKSWNHVAQDVPKRGMNSAGTKAYLFQGARHVSPATCSFYECRYLFQAQRPPSSNNPLIKEEAGVRQVLVHTKRTPSTNDTRSTVHFGLTSILLLLFTKHHQQSCERHAAVRTIFVYN